MSATVLQFRRTPAPVRQSAPTETPQYFCTRCDSDSFRAFNTGRMYCAKCGSLMRNLFVEMR